MTAEETYGGETAASSPQSRLSPKTMRRIILRALYDRYLESPLDMLTPDDLADATEFDVKTLLSSVHYLHERGFVELMAGYNPRTFAAVRITTDGVDLVENPYEFDLRFPYENAADRAVLGIPQLLERLSAEANRVPLDGWRRQTLVRDVQYLRDELLRPAGHWRGEVLRTVIGWIAACFDEPYAALPSLKELQDALERELA